MVEINKKSADYQAGVSAGANRMADFLIDELEGQVSADVIAMIESKRWVFVEKLFKTEMAAIIYGD